MTDILSAVMQNKILWLALLAWLIAQVLKTLVAYFSLGELNLERLLGAGGMPSSHSALVVSLVTGIGMTEGFASNAFAIATIFAGVVMYDAAGVRQAAGKHAKVLNQIIQQLRFEHKITDSNLLKELLGHTPVEVFAGALLGFVVAYCYCKLMFF